MQRYFKPKSLTWWSAVVPLIAGLVLAGEPLHGWSEVVEAINSATGNIQASVLINGGLVLIGLRAAPGMDR